MNDRAAFSRLVEALSPWGSKFVFIGGWAHRLYRLHPMAEPPAYQPLATLDADVAFAEGEPLEGNIRDRLIAAGFREELTGNHRPPISQYVLGEDEYNGFYAEFLTSLTGSGRKRDGKPLATTEKAGVTAQRLRHLELLLASPWNVALNEEWGTSASSNVHIPNPVSFVVQKLLIHNRRLMDKKTQDLLYIHDTLELFAPRLDELAELWQGVLKPGLNERLVQEVLKTKQEIFGRLSDRIRNAAAIPQDRKLDPERMRAMCVMALENILE